MYCLLTPREVHADVRESVAAKPPDSVQDFDADRIALCINVDIQPTSRPADHVLTPPGWGTQ
jgi:hypothetical protein